MKVSKEQFKQLRKTTRSNWRASVVSYLKQHNGCGEIELVDKTHPSGLGKDGELLSPRQKRNNLASLRTHLADDGYVIVRDENKLWLITEPNGNDIVVVPGQEERFKALTGQ